MRVSYIEECVINRHTVNIITVNGYQMIGVILDEDPDYIVTLCNGKKKMVYKHAISTIEPARNPKNNA